jgi:NAD(P)-dependent dehydrogenase (short-subunit alcohol dehydrogenase family)
MFRESHIPWRHPETTMAKLDGRIALITGGTSGIGHATAKLFEREGAHVIVTGRNPATVAEARESLGAGIEVIQSDGSDVTAIRALFEGIKARHGRLDIAFVNAGIAHFAPIAAVDEAFFDRQFSLNVRGAFFTMQQAVAIMPDGGSIILTASVAGVKGMENASVYSATKAALRSFGRTFAGELAPRRIRVNTVSPGPIETPIFGKMGLPPEVAEGVGQAMQAMVPLKRFGTAAEVASAVLFLASDDGAFVTGVDLLVDGGIGSL